MLLPTEVLNQRLIVEPLERKDQEVNGIIVPGSANAELSEGKVLLADKTIPVSEGDTVLFPSGAGVGQFFNGKSCTWLHLNDIWAIV